MQTKVQTPADQSKQNQTGRSQVQLNAGQQAIFEDHRKHVTQLKSAQEKMSASPQQQGMLSLQARMATSSPVQQLKAQQARVGQHHQPTPNNTGLPDNLKAGIESLSGMNMDHVKVHYNSGRPAQLQAHAYAQGSEIHVAPGQEKHLPHEAWHVVQQAQGRVKPSMQMKSGVPVNDDVSLEAEADVMGALAENVESSADRRDLAAPQSMDSGTAVTQSFAGDVNAPLQLSREYGYYSRDGKRKSPRVIIMEEFGDRNRVHDVQPDLYRERLDGEDENDVPEERIDKKTGIWRAGGESSRPEDPPIYQPFRTAFHRLHNMLLSMMDVERIGDDVKQDYKNRFLAIGADVKQLSLDYKANVRNVDDGRMTMEAAKQEYIDGLDDLIGREDDGVNSLRAEILAEFTGLDGAPEGLDSEELEEHVDAEKDKRGEEIWRAQWWAAVQKVNLILKRTWSTGKSKIQAWVADKRKERTWYRRRDAIAYMEESMVGDVDYIGSLAKGYKSPPKQYVRFMSEKFDVDGNLSAPPLAVYAINQGAAVDRGSVKAGQYVPPLRDFEQATWNELKQVPGVDQGDPFEVFVRADGVNEIVTNGSDDVAKAQRVVSTSNRTQAIKDRLWNVRTVDNALFNNLKVALGAYLGDNGELQEREGEEEGTFIPLDDTDLTFIEATIRSFEVQIQND